MKASRLLRSALAASLVVGVAVWAAPVSAQPMGTPLRPPAPTHPHNHLPPAPAHPILGRAHLPLRTTQVSRPVDRVRPGRRPGPAGSASVIYTPANILSAYDFGSLANGSGQTIVLVEAYGDPSLATDVATFDAQWGLPAPTLNVYTVDGRPGGNSGWALETALDVEWAHAEAPAATIDVVEAANSNLQDLLDAVVSATQQLAPNELSMSWGAPESDYTASSCTYGTAATTCLAAFEDAFTAARSAGVVLLAASGDSGAYDNGTSLSVNYPAASPEVIGVGGTTLTLNSAGGYGGETAWADSGGGYSAEFPVPSFQPVSLPARGVPDVSFDANPNTGVYVYQSPYWYQVGGTSLGAPSWAAIAADSAASAPVTLQRVYALYGGGGYASDFHDVTSGSNGYYSAGAGWDPVTGVGTPDVAGLLTAPPAAALALSPSNQAQTIAAGSTATYTFTLSSTGVSGTATLSTAPAPPLGWSVSGVPASVSVSPGSPATVTMAVYAPPGTAPGTSFAETLRAASGSLSTSATATTSILSRGVSLAPTGSTAGSGAPGGSVSYTYTLTNTGNASDTFTLSATSASGWTVGASPADVTLAPGASQAVTLTVAIPAGAATGSSDQETLTASDGGGASASAGAATTVAAQATTVSVSSVGYAAHGSGLQITVSLADNLSQPVSGASVSIEVYLNGRAYARGTASTGSGGSVTFSLGRAPRGTYTTTVTAVSAAGLTWNGTTPANSYTK